MMRRIVTILGFCAAALVVTCSDDSGPTGPGGSNPNVYIYETSGNAIYLFKPPFIETRCESATLISDTTPAEVDTAGYLLLNNGNFLVIRHHDGEIQSFTRVGAGTGIQGQWTMQGMTVQIDDGTVTLIPDWADQFIGEWAAVALQANITATKNSSSSVTLTGNTSQEVVTVTFNSVGDATYSSTNSLHTTAVDYKNPVSCPNGPPAWTLEFIYANGGVLKVAMTALSAALPMLHTCSINRRF